MKYTKLTAGITFMGLLATGCNQPSPSQIQKMLVDNPDILVKAIEANPMGIIESLNKAARSAQAKQAEQQQADEEKAREEQLKNPLKPEIEQGRAIWGKAEAPITIVEYSDFECPYCKRGHSTVQEVVAKYGDKVRVVYKHLPLDFHKWARPAAEYFEAIAMQDGVKAYKFHDIVFENQARLKEGDKFLDEAATKAGADLAKLKKDIKSEAVQTRIKNDTAEAQKFEIQGTPAFIINGVALKGAYPAKDFIKIIEMSLKAQG